MSLINLGEFRLASGQKSKFKLDCDALSQSDLEAVAAYVALTMGRFGGVTGVPTGGLRLAEELEKYTDDISPVHLVVDDVYTTGKSIKPYMEAARLEYGAANVKMFVIFNRSAEPLSCLFKVDDRFNV